MKKREDEGKRIVNRKGEVKCPLCGIFVLPVNDPDGYEVCPHCGSDLGE